MADVIICAHGAGGETEAQAAYDEAMNAVFNLQLECHRHAQPHKSKKDGKIKWAMIEMWPIVVSKQHNHTKYQSAVAVNLPKSCVIHSSSHQLGACS